MSYYGFNIFSNILSGDTDDRKAVATRKGPWMESLPSRIGVTQSSAVQMLLDFASQYPSLNFLSSIGQPTGKLASAESASADVDAPPPASSEASRTSVDSSRSDETLVFDDDLKDQLDQGVEEEDISDDEDDSDRPAPQLYSPNGQTYTVAFRIGEGATSHVMCATTHDGSQVAIKVVHKPQLAFFHAHPEERGSTFVPTASSILKERSFLQQVTDANVPFVTPLLDSFQDESNIYFVMPLCSQTLRSRMNEFVNRGETLPSSDIKFYAAQLLLAISSIHSLVISHRDIKPENILITPSGNICLADFGLTQTSLSRSAKRSIARFYLFSTAGTPAYWAPEVDGPHVKTKGFLAGPADMWSFGVVLSEMIFGGLEIPSEEDMNKLVTDGRVDPCAVDLVLRLLHMDPKKRPTAEIVKNHPFFDCIDWQTLADSDVPAPYIPGPVKPADPNSSVAFSTWRCLNSLRTHDDDDENNQTFEEQLKDIPYA